jgi:hypothetical protein
MVRDDAAVRAHRRLLRDLAGNVAASVATIRDGLTIAANAGRPALA